MIRVPELPICSPLRLTRYRKALGFTQEDAARFVRVSVGTWRNWEQVRVTMPDTAWELFLIKANRRLKLQKEKNK